MSRKSIFGGDHPLIHPSILIRDESALAESGEEQEDKTSQNSERLQRNLGIVSFNLKQVNEVNELDEDTIKKIIKKDPDNWQFILSKLNKVNGKIGFDRDLLKKIIKKDPVNWKHNLLNAIEPSIKSLDPRNRHKKTIFEADSNLSDLVGTEVVIKMSEKSEDGMTPEMQFEAGKILEKEITRVGLDDIVSVNKAFGYIQQGKKKYLFLEKVYGCNFQQMQKGLADEIPQDQVKMIFDKLIEKLNQIKTKISTNPDFIEGEKLFHQDELQNSINANDEAENKIDSQEDPDNFSSKYPYGVYETNLRYKMYFVDKNQKIKRLNILIEKLIYELENPSKDKYNLISEVLIRILLLESSLRISYYGEIKKSADYGQDNLMWDSVNKKIVIIDPGPPQR